MITIPESYQDLVNRSVKTFAYLATLMPDGSPQVTPVWFEYIDGDVLVNTVPGRVKSDNMDERPQVALLIPDPKNAYRYLQLRGKVVDSMEEGAVEHIHSLSRYYTGHDYHLPAGQRRIIYRIRPESIDIKN